ncbi:MAG: hypothetical protein ACTSPD_17755 [Promethearchaeota archaeon]
MGTLENHKKLYQNFKKDAENEDNSETSRAELYFLSIFHLIETCAAKQRIHINKHHKVRKMLEENPTIFENQTEAVWRLFQNIENRLRPKFTYGFSWNSDDFNKLKEFYYDLEKICLTVI